MKHVRFLRLALVVGLAASGLAAFTADAPPETVVVESASHSITIEYLDTRGDYRRAQVTIQPVRGGGRPAWRGEAQSFRLLGNGTLSRRERAQFERADLSTTHILSSGFGTDAVMVAPSPRTLVGIEITPVRGRSVRFLLPGMTSRGEGGDTDEPSPEEPKPDPDPEPDPEPTPDPPDDDDDFFCNPFSDLSCDQQREGRGVTGPAGPATGNDQAVSFTF